MWRSTVTTRSGLSTSKCEGSSLHPGAIYLADHVAPGCNLLPNHVAPGCNASIASDFAKFLLHPGARPRTHPILKASLHPGAKGQSCHVLKVSLHPGANSTSAPARHPRAADRPARHPRAADRPVPHRDGCACGCRAVSVLCGQQVSN